MHPVIYVFTTNFFTAISTANSNFIMSAETYLSESSEREVNLLRAVLHGRVVSNENGMSCVGESASLLQRESMRVYNIYVNPHFLELPPRSATAIVAHFPVAQLVTQRRDSILLRDICSKEYRYLSIILMAVYAHSVIMGMSYSRGHIAREGASNRERSERSFSPSL